MDIIGALHMDGLLANSHRFAHSVMSLETDLYYDPNAPAPVDRRALSVFVDDVDTTLRALVAALRDPSQRLDGLPDLRADQRALVDGSDTQLIQADPRSGA